LDILAEVFPRIKKEIPEVELYAYTGGQLGILKPEDKVRAENLIKAAQLAGIKIMGNIPRKDLARELQKSSLMVYPSHAVPEAAFYAETSCMAALEAQAAGVPVVASKRGALPETIQDQKTGILIDGDPFSLEYQDKFIEQTVSLLNDPERWKKFSKNAQDYIQSRYSWKTIAQEWEKEFNRIIGL
jgi:glycosyltransferase involved in cell wall biosynthesis